eukprot:TRINITY_DN6760_c0_g1_i2.p1 TRINITY_DN6760_c0_g1~~TRINITY_DN6760_c0_g1_i2.p1  ORF type:complete len:150 (+),score=11.74 TRINITY_DN6760_c0_g1_i2:422-871(+)
MFSCPAKHKALQLDDFEFQVSHQWYTMQSNCDPGKLANFKPSPRDAASGLSGMANEKAGGGEGQKIVRGDGDIGLLLGLIVATCAMFGCVVAVFCWYSRRRARIAEESVVVDVSIRTESRGNAVRINAADTSCKHPPHIAASRDDIEEG